MTGRGAVLYVYRHCPTLIFVVVGEELSHDAVEQVADGVRRSRASLAVGKDARNLSGLGTFDERHADALEDTVVGARRAKRVVKREGSALELRHAARIETAGCRTTAASVVLMPTVLGPHARTQLKFSPPSASSASKAGRMRVQTVKHDVCRPLSAFICLQARMMSFSTKSVRAAAAASALEAQRLGLGGHHGCQRH